MVLTADEELAARVRSLRSHAMTSGTWDRHRGHEDVLRRRRRRLQLPPRRAARRARARRGCRGCATTSSAAAPPSARYREALAGTPGLTLMWTDADVARSSHFAFPVLFDERRRARGACATRSRGRGIQTTRYPALHR